MWSKIEESSSDDETLGNSFFTNGLFKISNEEKSTKNPRINANLQNKKISVSVDKSLILLENESTFDCKFLSFSAEIQAISVSRSGDLIVCCLADGNIHGVHIKGIPVFNMIIQDEDISELTSFLEIKQINDEFYIMCANGGVYKLFGIDESVLSDMVLGTNVDETCVFNETVLKTVQLEKVAKVNLPRELFAFCCIPTYNGDVFVVSGSECVYFVSNDFVSRVPYPENIKTIKKVYNIENYVIGLTETGQLVEICPYTKKIFTINMGTFQAIVDDIRVLEANDDYIELLVLSAVNGNEREMKIVDFPSFNVKSELSLPAVSWLVTQQKSSLNMYFIAGSRNDFDFIQTIEIRSITETDPEQRFKKLLQRGHFEEAEAFAKEYDLNLEPLHQARVKRSIMDFSRIKTHSKEFEEAFKVLMSQLASVTDKNFLVTLYHHEIPDRTCMTTFLEYLLANIDTNKNETETNEINELLLRLETLRLIDPDDCNMQWMKFLHNPDMLRVAMDHFKTDVSLSCLVWSRHSSSIIPKLNLEHFHRWLSNISSAVEPFQLVQWLKHFSPCFLQTYPEEMTHLVDWCLERTRGLQFSTAWPEIGLEFINNINGIFNEMKFMLVDIRRLHHNNMVKLQQMIFTLEEMLVLKKTYHLTMTFDDYSKGLLEETAFRLLQRIQINNLKRLVNDFLYPIFMEQGETPEDTIVQYVDFLCNNKHLNYWQERAVIAIELLSNEENRLNCALRVLKMSPVPWSEVVMPLARLGTTSSHPVAQMIYVEFKTQSIKMIKVKYQWPADYFDLQRDRIKLVNRVLKVNGPDMIEDVKTLVKSSPDIAREAYSYLLLKLVKLGQIEELMEVVESIEQTLDIYQMFFETFVNMCVMMLDDESESDPEKVDSMLEAIILISNRLKPSWENYAVEFHEQKIASLKNILKVRAEFKLNLKLKNLNSKVERNRMMEEGISMVAVIAREKSSLDSIWRKVDLLSSTFGFDRIHGYTLLCKKLNNLYVTCHIVDVLSSSIEVVDKSEIESVLELTVVMIAQQIAYFENNLSSNFDNYDPLTFPLAYEFLLKCHPHHDILRHSSIMKLLTWMSIGRNYYPFGVLKATRKSRVIDATIFTSKATNGNGHHHIQNGNKRESFSMFEAVEIKAEVKQQQTDENLNPVLRSVCNSLKLMIYATDMAVQPYRRFLDHLTTDGDQQQVKNDFFASLENILKLKQYKPAVKIIKLVVEQQAASKVLIIPPMFVTNVNKKILKFMLSQKEPDYMCAFRIFRAETNRSECLDYLRSAMKNNSQKIAFATFSEMYNKYMGDSNTVADERQNRLKFYYYSELCKYDQSLRFKINDNTSINDLLKDLEGRQLSVELVKKLSRDFSRDYQKELVQQIKILLRAEKLDFDVKTDVFGKEEVVMKSSVESIRKKCDPYLNEVTNLPLLAVELMSFIKEINFYFYEMYLAVFEIIEYAQDLTPEQKVFRNILIVLKHQLTSKRHGAKQMEVDCWMKLQPDNSVLPGISKYRLPFKPMMESTTPEVFLDEDLNVDTFERCIPLITLHASFIGVGPEERLELCGFQAVKNSVVDLKAKQESNNIEWKLKSTNNGFLQTILRMISLISEKSKRMAILYFYVNHAPQGSDQVEAAFEAWKFATANEQEIAASARYSDLVDRIKRKYPLVKTQHLLHVYGLTEEKLMQLVENPTELINALYHHESILQLQKKDINKLCSELAQLYGIELLTLQNKLLRKWLAYVGNSSFDECSDINETVYEDFIGSPTTCDDTEFVSDENVVRAHYILSSWKSQEAMDFLASELSSSSGENQLQLYECFAKLIDDESESYMELINPNEFLLAKCCHYLKALGLNYKPENFKDMDKLEILKRVWTSHHNNSKGLEVMSYICLGFDIHLPQIWNGILKQMVQLKMVSHLSILVEILSTKSKLLHLSSLKLAWECVMKEPFLHATKNRSYAQEVKLSKTFILLQKCPISTFLDFKNLIELCLRLERPHMAAIFVAFINEKSRGEFVKALEAFDKRELRKDIEELEEMGIAPVITKSVTNILKL